MDSSIFEDELMMLGAVSPSIKSGEPLVLGRELRWYYGQLNLSNEPDYFSGVERVASEIPEFKQIDNSTKVIVTVPCYVIGDWDKVYGFLSLYARQEEVDLSSVLIVFNFNWQDKDAGKIDEIEKKLKKIYAQMEKAREDFPQLRFTSFIQPNHQGIYYVAKQLNDIVMLGLLDAIKEKRLDSDAKVLVIRTDADIEYIHRRYLASYLETAAEHPHTPVFYGMIWNGIEYAARIPGFAAVNYFDRMFILLFNLERGVYTIGGNFCYRAEYYAAMSGLGYNCFRRWSVVGSDDLQIGYRFRKAFLDRLAHEDTSVNEFAKDAIVEANGMRLVSVYAESEDYTIVEAYGAKSKYSFENSGARPTEAVDLVEDIDDEESFARVVKKFELEVSDYFKMYGTESELLLKTIDVFFEMDSRDLYELLPVEDSEDLEHERKFKLTEEGRKVFKDILRDRFGDGKNYGKNNTVHNAIIDGTLIGRLEYHE